MKKLIGVLVAALLGGGAFAAPVVNDLKVTAIPPWGLALDYTVSEVTAGDVGAPLVVMATDGEKSYSARNLVGETNCMNGAHRVYWNMAADGLTAIAVNSTVTVKYRLSYCIIDLSAGANATAYPVSYLSAVPVGGWTDEYKTSKIVLRRIDGPSGTYYAGVFEVTEAQWNRVMGGTSMNMKPKNQVSVAAIRGAAWTYDWPSSNDVESTSFMGCLRQRTGLATLDLPSEVEWEYAARAGVATTWLCGDSETGLGDYAWYSANSGSATHSVGALRANAWGLYDVHGNVWEWCLNRYEDSFSGRVLRGGSFRNNVLYCTFAYRSDYHGSAGGDVDVGFRVFCRPESN